MILISLYCIVAISNTSHLEVHPGIFRLLMKVIFYSYVLLPFEKKNDFLKSNSATAWDFFPYKNYELLA